MLTKETFERYAEHYNLFLAWPGSKAQACQKNEFWKHDNLSWGELIESQPRAEGYNVGLKLGMHSPLSYVQSTWGNYLICLEADTPEGRENLEAFIKKHKAEDGLVWFTKEKHYLFKADFRFDHIKKMYQGFEILTTKVLIPPSTTNGTERGWRPGDEGRFLAGEVPTLPETAVEELLLNTPRKVASGSLGQLPCSDADYSWLVELGFEHLGENDWRRPGSHTGARSLVTNTPAEGLVTVFSTGLVDAKGSSIEPRTYNAVHLAALMLGLPIKEACTKLKVPEVERWAFGRVPFAYDSSVSFVLYDLQAVNKSDGSKKKNPQFSLAMYVHDEIRGPVITKLSTADSKMKQLAIKLHDTLQFDEEDREEACRTVVEVVQEKADEAFDEYNSRLEEGAEGFKAFTRELQSIVIKELLAAKQTLVWRELILRQDDEGYWYNPLHCMELRKEARLQVKQYLPEAQTRDVNEIEASIMTECRIPNDEKLTLPANLETGEPLRFAVAFKDGLWDVEADKKLDHSKALVIDVIPYTKAEVMDASTEIIDRALDLWFGDNTTLQSRKGAYLMAAGLCLVSYRPQRFLYFQGPPGTAKSESAVALGLLLGSNMVVRKPGWQALRGDHALDRFQNARLAILQDVGRRCPEEAMNALKNITGENFLEINAKYVRQVEIVKQCLVVATSNYDPPEEAAIKDRIYRIPFMHKLRNTDEQVDDWALTVLKPFGMPGFYRRAIQGLQAFISNKYSFPVVPEQLAEQELMLELSNALQVKCVPAERDYVKVGELLQQASCSVTSQKDAVKLLRAMDIEVSQSSRKEESYIIKGWTLKRHMDEF